MEGFLSLLDVLQRHLTLIVGLALELVELHPRGDDSDQGGEHRCLVGLLVQQRLLLLSGEVLTLDETSDVPGIGVVFRLIVSQSLLDEAACFGEVCLITRTCDLLRGLDIGHLSIGSCCAHQTESYSAQ